MVNFLLENLTLNHAEALNPSIVNEYYDLQHTVLTDN